MLSQRRLRVAVTVVLAFLFLTFYYSVRNPGFSPGSYYKSHNANICDALMNRAMEARSKIKSSIDPPSKP